MSRTAADVRHVSGLVYRMGEGQGDRPEPPCGVARCLRAGWFVAARAARREPRSGNLCQGSVRLGSSNSTMSAADAARSWSSTCT